MFLNPMLFAAALFTTPATPQTVVDDLLNVDRSFSSAAAATDPVSGLATMLDADAVTPVPGKGIVEGRDAVTAVLRSSLLARGDKIGWTPIRGGVSAAGTHGFTFGYLTLDVGDHRVTAPQTLSYWIKRTDGSRGDVSKPKTR